MKSNESRLITLFSIRFLFLYCVIARLFRERGSPKISFLGACQRRSRHETRNETARGQRCSYYLTERFATAGVEKGLIIAPSLRRDRRQAHPCSRGPLGQSKRILCHIFGSGPNYSTPNFVGCELFPQSTAHPYSTSKSTGNKRKLISWPVRLVESRALVSERGGGSAKSSSPVRLEQRFSRTSKPPTETTKFMCMAREQLHTYIQIRGVHCD